MQLRMDVLGAAAHAAEAWVAAVSAHQASSLRSWLVTPSVGVSCGGAIADAGWRFCDAVAVERRCSHGVQLQMDVTSAAARAAEAWQAAVSVYCRASLAAAAVALHHKPTSLDD